MPDFTTPGVPVLPTESLELMALICAIVLLTTLAHGFTLWLFRQLLLMAEKTVNQFDDAFVIAAKAPAIVGIWCYGALWVIRLVGSRMDWLLVQLAPTVHTVLSVVLLTWFLMRLLLQFEQLLHVKASQQSASDRLQLTSLGGLARSAIIVSAMLIILQTLGFSISGVLAVGGVGGIALGFAAKDLLANVFGGLMIFLDRPFAIGDWVRSPDQNIEGTVEQIGWRSTRIRTFDKRPLYVPNSVFTHISVENPARMSHRRIHETVGLRYQDVQQMEMVLQEIREFLQDDKAIDERQTLMVNFDRFSASSLDFFIYCFTHTTDWVRFHQEKQRILLAVAAIIARHGAEIAYPTTTVQLLSEPASE